MKELGSLNSLVCVHSLHIVHTELFISVHLFVCMIELESLDVYEVRYENEAIVDHPKHIHFSFLELVIV